MKYKGLFTIFIAVVFVLIAVFTVFSVFKIKDIDVSYEVFEDDFNVVDSIDGKLDDFRGKNLLFLDTDDIVGELSQYTRFEVVSIEKSYPNSLEISIKQRRDRFFVNYNGKNYIVASDGFVVEETIGTVDGLIELKPNTSLSGNKFSFVNVAVGQFVQTTDDNAFDAMLSVVNTQGVSGILTSVEVFSAFETNHLIMDTATEVNIEIVNFKNRGIEKAQALIDRYEGINDYLKANSKIYVTESAETGAIDATWSSNG